MALRKIFMPIGDASETLDTFYAYFRIPEDGFQVVVAGPEARVYHTVMHEIPPDGTVPWDITREQPSYHLRADVAFSQLDPLEFAGMFVSGGRAPEYLRYNSHLLRLVKAICDAGRPVACLCHGIEILAAAQCIRGKRVTTVPKCALDAEQGGAQYVDVPYIVDGTLVTGRGWQDNTHVLREFMRMLRERAEH